MIRTIRLVAFLALAHSFAAHSHAQSCAIPVDFDSLQSALNEPGCASILIDAVVLVENVAIDRAVAVEGIAAAPSLILGRVSVSGAGVEADLSDLRIDTSRDGLEGCFDQALFVSGGAEVTLNRVTVANSDGSGDCNPPSYVFFDGFEDP